MPAAARWTWGLGTFAYQSQSAWSGGAPGRRPPMWWGSQWMAAWRRPGCDWQNEPPAPNHPGEAASSIARQITVNPNSANRGSWGCVWQGIWRYHLLVVPHEPMVMKSYASSSTGRCPGHGGNHVRAPATLTVIKMENPNYYYDLPIKLETSSGSTYFRFGSTT